MTDKHCTAPTPTCWIAGLHQPERHAGDHRTGQRQRHSGGAHGEAAGGEDDREHPEEGEERGQPLHERQGVVGGFVLRTPGF